MHYTAIGETEKAMQRFLMTRQDIGEENIPVLLLLSFQRNLQLSAVCQIPQDWKQTGNYTTTTTFEGRPYLKPYYNEENLSTSVDHQYTSRF